MSGTVVMKFGGTSVADAERLKRAARRIVAKREAGNRVVAVLSARGKTTDFLIAEAQEISPNAGPAGDGHAAVDRRAPVVRAVRDGDQRPWAPRDLPDRVTGGHRDRHVAHEGEDPRCARRSDPARPRRGRDRARRGLPGRVDRKGRHDARPRRLGHHRRGARSRDRGRDLRDLHRRRGRLQRRPADRARRPQAAGRLVRGDARDVVLRGRRAAAALAGVRAQPRRSDPLPIELHR